MLADTVLRDIEEAMPIVEAVMVYAGVPGPLASLFARYVPRILRALEGDGGAQLEAMLASAEDAYLAARGER